MSVQLKIMDGQEKFPVGPEVNNDSIDCFYLYVFGHVLTDKERRTNHVIFDKTPVFIVDQLIKNYISANPDTKVSIGVMPDPQAPIAPIMFAYDQEGRLVIAVSPEEDEV